MALLGRNSPFSCCGGNRHTTVVRLGLAQSPPSNQKAVIYWTGAPIPLLTGSGPLELGGLTTRLAELEPTYGLSLKLRIVFTDSPTVPSRKLDEWKLKSKSFQIKETVMATASPDAIREPHQTWSNWPTFILAVSGSAVGLGNIWKFPYITGENGGGAFVLIYLVCIFAIGLPIMMAEIMLGRRGRRSPVNSMRALAVDAKRSPRWALLGALMMAAAFIIL